MRVVALVDGEHYPSVVQWGLASARAEGYQVEAAVLVGGGEKLFEDPAAMAGSGVIVLDGRPDPSRAVGEAIGRFRPEALLDLSGEPVLGDEARMLLAAKALAAGVAYVGPDFRFHPPVTEPRLPAPALAVIGTGKRVGKTAVAGHAARLAAADGLRPAIVAMGRGGPAEPVVAEAVSLADLLGRADRREHAASDYLEDAVTAGVPTVGARRCGGGLAGRPFATNVGDAARMAAAGGADPVILEGSGSSVPTVPWDAAILVASGAAPAASLGGWLGPFRVLLSDVLVLIIEPSPSAGPDNLSALVSVARRLHDGIRVVIAELQPVALADVRGRDAFFATTAHHELAGRLAGMLERSAGCRVVSFSSHLADRAALERDLAAAPSYDVLLTELKASAVDVAARRAVERGAGVVFVDNRPATVGGDGDVDAAIRQATALARRRAGR